VIAGSLRILGSTSPKPEVLENARYDLFSRTVTLTLGRTSVTLAVRQSRHWRMMMRKIELPRWRKIAKSWGFSARNILLTSSALILMRKAYSPMHGNAWPKFTNFTFAPNFYLWSDSFGVWSRDAGWPSGSPVKIWEESPQGNGSYEFSKFPILSLWEI